MSTLANTTGRRFNASHALLAVGLLLTLFAVMFRPTGAEATLPTKVQLYLNDTDTNPAIQTLGGFPEVTRTYKVKLRGKRSATAIDLTGIPLADLVKNRGEEIDVTKIPYVKVRLGGTNDGNIVLVPLTGVNDDGLPPMILNSGKRPGLGAFTTPALVRGHAATESIDETKDILTFDRRKQVVSLIPGTGSILGVRISKKKTKDGEYRFTARVSGSPGGALQYQWFTQDEPGKATAQTGTNVFTTSGTKGTTKGVTVSVVVKAVRDGSTGAGYSNFTTSKTDNGAKVDPRTGSGFGASGPSGAVSPGTGSVPGTNPTPGPLTPTPNVTPTPTPTFPTPTTPQPTPPTAATPQQETAQTPVPDTTGLIEIASKTASGGPVQTISGVLLAQAASAPSTSGGGGGSPTPLTALQSSVQELANSIFQPVGSTRDLWPYLIALLFALGFTGAVREWVNP